MTNSQKAFEDWWSSSKDAERWDIKNTWQAAWEARGEFDEEVLKEMEKEKWESFGRGEFKTCSAKDFIDEIRKRGGE